MMAGISFEGVNRQDGSGKTTAFANGEQVLQIYWRGENGVTPLEVIGVTRRRMELEQKGGPFADPKAAKAIACLMQAEAELSGNAGPDGVPILGATE
jgi:phage-related baseplate assembly protein